MTECMKAQGTVKSNYHCPIRIIQSIRYKDRFAHNIYRCFRFEDLLIHELFYEQRHSIQLGTGFKVIHQIAGIMLLAEATATFCSIPYGP